MSWHRGIAVALAAAGLFGIGTPLSKLLLAQGSAALSRLWHRPLAHAPDSP